MRTREGGSASPTRACPPSGRLERDRQVGVERSHFGTRRTPRDELLDRTHCCLCKERRHGQGRRDEACCKDNTRGNTSNSDFEDICGGRRGKCRRSHALTIGCTSVSHLRRGCSSSSKPSDRDSCNSRNRRCKRRRFNPTWFRTEPARRTSNAVSGVVARSPRTEGAPAEEFAFKVATRPRPSGARKRRRRRRPPRTPLFLTCTVSGLLVAYSSQRIQRFMSLLPNHHGSTLPRRRQR
jgi:hypothetical protein